MTVYMTASSFIYQDTRQTDFDISSCLYQLSENITETFASGYVITYRAIVFGCIMGDYSLGTHFVVSLNGLDSSLKGTDPRFMYMYTDKYFQQILSTTHYHGEKKQLVWPHVPLMCPICGVMK